MSFIPGMRAPEFALASMNLHYSLLFFWDLFPARHRNHQKKPDTAGPQSNHRCKNASEKELAHTEANTVPVACNTPVTQSLIPVVSAFVWTVETRSRQLYDLLNRLT